MNKIHKYNVIHKEREREKERAKEREERELLLIFKVLCGIEIGN